MKRFIISVFCFFAIPFLLLLGIYIITDPYRTVGKFDPSDIDETNREYFSTELFLRNNPTMQYNAFVFCSSKGGGINTYLWRELINDSIRPFVFQAWADDIVGMCEKLDFLDKNGSHVDYALILLDLPSSFTKNPHDQVINLRHYLLDGGNRFTYNTNYFVKFAQKPSQWMKAVKNKVSGVKLIHEYDTIWGDRFASNKDCWRELPPQDSLCYCTELTRQTFLREVTYQKESDIVYGEPSINGENIEILQHMKDVLDRQRTKYKILICPQYVFKNPMANLDDVKILGNIFGAENVYNYSVDCAYTRDYNYLSDPSHFGVRLGSLILQEMYGAKPATFAE